MRLYLQTETGRIPIAPEVAEQMGLKAGMISPFTRLPVVEEGGEQKPPEERPKAQLPPQTSDAAPEDDGVALMDGAALSPSEIIDFAQGTDSLDEPEEQGF